MTIAIDNLTAGYRRTPVLRDISVPELGDAAVVGVLGANGAGKSTFIKTLAGVLKPLAGQVHVRVDGRQLRGRQVRDAVGYVPQDLLATAELTVLESVLLCCGKNGEATAAAALEEVGIIELSHRLLGELSGGQRQLTAVAQMFARNPQVMLLDEPTSALDIKHQVHVLDLVRRRARANGATAVVAIHDLNLASRYCDELLIFAEGGLACSGTPSEVMNSHMLEDVYGFCARVLDDQGVPVVCPVAAERSLLSR